MATNGKAASTHEETTPLSGTSDSQDNGRRLREALGFALLDEAIELLANDRLGELGHDLPGDLLDDLLRGGREGGTKLRLSTVCRLVVMSNANSKR